MSYLSVAKEEYSGDVLESCFHHDLLEVISPFRYSIVLCQLNLEEVIFNSARWHTYSIRQEAIFNPAKRHIQFCNKSVRHT